MDVLALVPVVMALGLGLMIGGVVTRPSGTARRLGRSAREARVPCPHLGLEADPLTHIDDPSDEHRCYFQLQRSRIDLVHQEMFCLSGNHVRCPWLVAAPRSESDAGSLGAVGARLRLEAEDWGNWAVWVIQTCEAQVRRAQVVLRVKVQPHVESFVVWLGPQAGPAVVWLWGRGVAAAKWLAAMAMRGLRWLAPRVARVVAHVYHSIAPRVVEQGQVLVERAPEWAAGAGRMVSAGTGALSRVRRGEQKLEHGVQGESPSVQSWVMPESALQETAGPVAAATAEGALASAVVSADAADGVAEAAATAAPGLREKVARSGQKSGAEGALIAGDLIARGIAALEANDEDQAYGLFVQACKKQAGDARAWVWRAKTAPTLDEVVSCLERAATLAPDNSQVQANLEWARSRVEREQLAHTLAQEAGKQRSGRAKRAAMRAAPGTVRSRRGALLFKALTSVVGGIATLIAATGCLVVGLLWIGGLVSPDIVATLDGRAAALLRLTPQLEMESLQQVVNLEILDGYNVVSALPYVLGFFALLAALGLWNRENWARWWAPLIAMTSLALWINFASSPLPPQLLVGLSTTVAIAGPLASAQRTVS